MSASVMSLSVVLMLGIAGGLGAVARFMLDGFISPIRGVVPIGTMAVNISGSLVLGVLTGLVLAVALPSSWLLVGGTGFLGGYTTFSTASSETVRLIQAGQTRAALLSGVGTALAALAAAGLGLVIGFVAARMGGL
ncbi:fluoride efflux transporter CrcB [Arthrobacter agilis]|uniref:fluoride efflux transporter CrcB n=1 Tax=Arthrobacter agilis TaxID=37921 RepID=UPI002782AC18|nr:fluoride efflux transporter CrcB [Arthrobacter agilis]MDQ0735952.1 CrcB protein [Arthrobacter agilis]